MQSARQHKSKTITEFGDFQTPLELAFTAIQTLRDLGIRPRSILEPTCGRGTFLDAAAKCFPDAESIIGIDINQSHLRYADLIASRSNNRIDLRQGDFFKVEWESIVTKTSEPWMIVGNPPWVTSSNLSAIESDNLPEKSNFHGRMGIEAITGKSNFDISEWMILRYLDWFDSSEGTIAVLCKTAVARKILLHIWKKGNVPLRAARIYKIDAPLYFGASVDACFFVLEIHPQGKALDCEIFTSLKAEAPSHRIGFLDGHIIPHIAAFNMHRNLLGPENRYVWRSGIKHDCSKVMELIKTPAGYRNGLGETVAIEEYSLFPLLKSSDIGNGRIECRAAMVVTQSFIGESTGYLRTKAPKTWQYLESHAKLLEKRGSIIYKNKPAYSIFGVGPYTFASWKVAISGFYKKLHFVKIGPVNGKPVVFDDTIYFLPCWSEAEADFLESLLCSQPAQAFLESMIHWDEKRPITVEILKRLSIQKLAALLGRDEEYARFTDCQELPLFAAL
jgi:methylase of polypeptide subunit release factors